MRPTLHPMDRFIHHPAFCPLAWGAAIPTTEA
jgi:hypothetical protein